jgi:hypothetical protein
MIISDSKKPKKVRIHNTGWSSPTIEKRGVGEMDCSIFLRAVPCHNKTTILLVILVLILPLHTTKHGKKGWEYELSFGKKKIAFSKNCRLRIMH